MSEIVHMYGVNRYLRVCTAPQCLELPALPYLNITKVYTSQVYQVFKLYLMGPSY